jgi:hypothetical protein
MFKRKTMLVWGMRMVIGIKAHRFLKGTVTQLMQASFVVSKFRNGRGSGRAKLYNGCDCNCPTVRHFTCDGLKVPFQCVSRTLRFW